MSDGIDIERLRELQARIATLRDEKNWGRETFLRVLQDAREAANGFDDACEFVFFHAEAAWLEPLQKPERPARTIRTREARPRPANPPKRRKIGP
ncbi:MAG: hypothetical protein JWM80_928 [Cyanobacteria bacterium RYN_339]|nr:hypothetical protein [Cyanobacteria bacterium RYN_339]